MEAAYFIATGNLTDLAESALVDCDTEPLSLQGRLAQLRLEARYLHRRGATHVGLPLQAGEPYMRLRPVDRGCRAGALYRHRRQRVCAPAGRLQPARHRGGQRETRGAVRGLVCGAPASVWGAPCHSEPALGKRCVFRGRCMFGGHCVFGGRKGWRGPAPSFSPHCLWSTLCSHPAPDPHTLPAAHPPTLAPSSLLSSNPPTLQPPVLRSSHPPSRSPPGGPVIPHGPSLVIHPLLLHPRICHPRIPNS